MTGNEDNLTKDLDEDPLNIALQLEIDVEFIPASVKHSLKKILTEKLKTLILA